MRLLYGVPTGGGGGRPNAQQQHLLRSLAQIVLPLGSATCVCCATSHNSVPCRANSCSLTEHRLAPASTGTPLPKLYTLLRTADSTCGGAWSPVLLCCALLCCAVQVYEEHDKEGFQARQQAFWDKVRRDRAHRVDHAPQRCTVAKRLDGRRLPPCTCAIT